MITTHRNQTLKQSFKLMKEAIDNKWDARLEDADNGNKALANVIVDDHGEYTK